MSIRIGACALSIALILFCYQTPAAAKPTYMVFDAPGAGTAAFQGTQGITLDRDGNISGTMTASDFSRSGFIRRNDGSFLGFSQLGDMEPAAVTPRGEIAGTYFPNDGSLVQGFRSTPVGTATLFGVSQADPQAGFQVSGINSKDVVSGFYWDQNFVAHGFIGAGGNGPITTFDAPDAGKTTESAGTYPWSLNGHAFGTGYYIDDASVRHGFLFRYSPTLQITEFDVSGAGTASGQGTSAYCINTSNTTVGTYSDTNGVRHGYLRAKNGKVSTFDAPGAGTQSGQGTKAFCLNHGSEATGWFIDSNNVSHGFVRFPSGKLVEFDVPGAGNGANQGTTPLNINNAGEIVGYIVDSANVEHGFARIP